MAEIKTSYCLNKASLDYAKNSISQPYKINHLVTLGQVLGTRLGSRKLLWIRPLTFYIFPNISEEKLPSCQKKKKGGERLAQKILLAYFYNLAKEDLGDYLQWATCKMMHSASRRKKNAFLHSIICYSLSSPIYKSVVNWLYRQLLSDAHSPPWPKFTLFPTCCP